MEKLEFQSKGTKAKLQKIEANKKLGKFCLAGAVFCGAVSIFWLGSFGLGQIEIGIGMGMIFVFSVALGMWGGSLYLNSEKKFKNEGSISIYSSHVSIFDNIRNTEIELKLNEIYSVKKEAEYMMSLQTAKGDYSVEIDDVNKVIHILEKIIKGR